MNVSQSNLNNSVLKAFDLLEHFHPDKPAWGVRELAQHIGANKSTIYRLLATLEHIGVLQQHPETEKYSLGLKLFELGHRVGIQSALVNKTHDILEEVTKEITENVHLGILQSNEVLVVDKVDSPKGLKLNFQLGSRSPLHCTSMGKTLLAFAEKQEEIIEELDLFSKTPYSLTQKMGLIAALNQIRKDGFALDREEYELGLICLGVPVFNQNGKAVAALSASGPANRFREEALKDYVAILQKGASAIQQKIGNFQIKF